MELLRVFFGLIAICLGIYLLIQLFKFKKEFDKAKNKQENFLQKWERDFSRYIMLAVAMVICGLTATVLSWF
ncbi:hypothetical protein HMPREF1210_01450 [Paenisporosarcina sp. HGH0030]|nr:hypothetical protein HMPREF1210_01450 [Paenisporosarcina sp. HGH0030]